MVVMIKCCQAFLEFSKQVKQETFMLIVITISIKLIASFSSVAM